MPGDVPASYWDACLFLSYIEGARDRTADLRELLEQAHAGKRRIATSVLSMTEVAFAKEEKDSRTLSPEVEHGIDALWVPGSPVKMVELHPSLAREARGLIRQALTNGQNLRPPDAIHLASALELDVDEFLTYDTKLLQMEKLVGIPIRKPIVEQGSLPLEPPSDLATS